MRLAVLAILCGALSAGAFDFKTQVGAAFSHQGRTCLEIANPRLKPGDRLRLIFPDEPQSVAEATIVKKDTNCGAEPGDFNYEIRTGASWKGVAIAVYGFSGPFNERGNRIAADLNQDRHEESFRSCTSAEGVHLTVWTGSPPKGTLRWHQYVYLGYDVEPTCTDAETKDPQ